MIISKKLKNFKNIKHGFFNRNGGSSPGIYKSLNCGMGSYDEKKYIFKNLNIVCKKIGCSRKKLVLLNQTHGNKFAFIGKKHKFNKKKIKADAFITNVKNVAIGILTADCLPILIYDQKLKIIAAIHVGWRGAYKDIVFEVLNFYRKKGSQNKNLHVALGPCITKKNYEIQKDFKNRFLKKSKKK